MSAADPFDRPLTATERRARDLLEPALHAWTGYLRARSFARTLPAAVQAGSAVWTRDRGSDDPSPNLTDGVRIAVQPHYALAYHQLHGARPGHDLHAVTYSTLVQALRFMGATPASKFSPADEYPPTFPRVRKVQGWWHLTPEMQRRLQFGHHVPVLTPRSGPRPKPVPMDPPAARSGRALRIAQDPLRILALLREYCDPERATALLSTAAREQRPLCTKGAGRSPARGSFAINVKTDTALVNVLGLVAYAEHSVRDRYGVRVLTLDSIGGELEALQRDNPARWREFGPCETFSAQDTPRPQRNQRGWWRVGFAALGLPEPDRDHLAGEVHAWWRHEEMQRELAVAPERVTPRVAPVPAAGPVAEPVAVVAAVADDDDPDYVQHIGRDGATYYEINRREDMTRDDRARLGLLYPHEMEK